MIIACPSCQTRYAVPDTAIGGTGRTVRCAKCRHSWHQDGPNAGAKPVAAPPAPAPTPTPSPTAAPTPPVEAAPQTDTQPLAAAPDPIAPPSAKPAGDAPVQGDLMDAPPSFRSGTVGPERNTNAERGVVSDSAAADSTTSPDPFAHEPPFKPRRNPIKLWTRAAIGFALVVGLLSVAIYAYGLPSWLTFDDPAMGEEIAGLEIILPIDEDDRRTLPDGTELFAASGSVINKGSERRDVPDMLIVLRNADDRIVYEQEIRAPADTLGPGEEIRFDEALLDIPRSAVKAEIGWAPSAL